MQMADKVVLVCSSTERTSTSVNGNSNKFHRWERQPDSSFLHTYGRVGTPGVSHTVPESKALAKMKSALKDGYRQVDVLGSSPATAASGSKIDVAKRAVDEIAAGDTEIEGLIRYLAAKNVHNITGSTTLKYDESTGLFSTPLGIVSHSTISQARSILASIQTMVAGDRTPDDHLVTDYLMLIPTDIGRQRPTFSTVFPTLTEVQRQNDILDSLSGSLTMALQSTDKTPTSIDRMWNVKIKRETSSKEIKRIEKKFSSTYNTSHSCSRAGLRIKNVYSLRVESVADAFEKQAPAIGNIEEMWHGTSAGNVLSIFAKGLIIPPSCSNGRMFGNGVYASRQSTKSLNYSYGYWSGTKDPNCFMFLVDVAMGNAHKPTRQITYLPAGYDSLDIAPGTCGVSNHEAIVFKTWQTNLVRLVEFTS